jgi:hypothetical protein
MGCSSPHESANRSRSGTPPSAIANHLPGVTYPASGPISDEGFVSRRAELLGHFPRPSSGAIVDDQLYPVVLF